MTREKFMMEIKKYNLLCMGGVQLINYYEMKMKVKNRVLVVKQRNKEKECASLNQFQVFYYLGELNDSLSYAPGAGLLFDVFEDSEYIHTLLAEANDDSAVIDPRLEAIVERMLDKCILDRKYQQAIGMAIECGRLNKLEEAVLRSDNVHSIINYCMVVSHSFVNRREYQLKVLRLLVKIYQQLPSLDYLSICQRLIF